MTATFIRLANMILVALLAGTSFGIWIGLNPGEYSASTYIEQQQSLVRALHTVMVSMVLLATAMSLVSAYLERQNKMARICLLVAAAFLVSCIFISRLGNLPIQTEILTWKLDSYPENWTALRERWWDYHILRTISELIALVLVAWTYVQNKRNG